MGIYSGLGNVFQHFWSEKHEKIKCDVPPVEEEKERHSPLRPSLG